MQVPKQEREGLITEAEFMELQIFARQCGTLAVFNDKMLDPNFARYEELYRKLLMYLGMDDQEGFYSA